VSLVGEEHVLHRYSSLLEAPYRLLGFIQMLGKLDADLMQFEAPEPVGGMTHEDMVRHSLDFFLLSEDLPDRENGITLSSSEAIIVHYSRNNLEAHARLTAKLRDLLEEIGGKLGHMPVDHYLGR
jgi:hypothetical protein